MRMAGVSGTLRALPVGVFPLARYPGWVNSVWKTEVELHLKGEAGRDPPDLATDSGSVKVVPLEEVTDIVKSAIPPSSEHPGWKSAVLREILDRQREQYRRTGSPSDLDGAIGITRMAMEISPADGPSRPRSLTDLERTSVAREESPRSRYEYASKSSTLKGSRDRRKTVFEKVSADQSAFCCMEPRVTIC